MTTSEALRSAASRLRTSQVRLTTAIDQEDDEPTAGATNQVAESFDQVMCDIEIALIQLHAAALLLDITDAASRTLTIDERQTT